MANVRRRGVTPDEFLRLALALPEAEAYPGYSEYTGLRVRGKGFGYLKEDSGTALLKATLEEQAAMTAESPEVFTPSYTSGRFGWVEVRLAMVDPDELRELITESWLLSAPARLAKAFTG
ncbi:hypothetical protein HNP84_005074 [Thermocatellispora tengchongensis]|uniref:MmcQ/YjbR family DNA-binding protein n=1 Tax=Thermocatellispora tengchongensis TaxID=1073253 RepID=A0A840P6P0_9ACTN|nr:MmcQ/YjbR family DNA-binding protein [Thermocatellispora tengchongensis]MBB5135338.1 hypothetical protein [Thermocatellispora tengchongensis]